MIMCLTHTKYGNTSVVLTWACEWHWGREQCYDGGEMVRFSTTGAGAPSSEKCLCPLVVPN